MWQGLQWRRRRRTPATAVQEHRLHCQGKQHHVQNALYNNYCMVQLTAISLSHMLTVYPSPSLTYSSPLPLCLSAGNQNSIFTFIYCTPARRLCSQLFPLHPPLFSLIFTPSLLSHLPLFSSLVSPCCLSRFFFCSSFYAFSFLLSHFYVWQK